MLSPHPYRIKGPPPTARTANGKSAPMHDKRRPIAVRASNTSPALVQEKTARHGPSGKCRFSLHAEKSSLILHCACKQKSSPTSGAHCPRRAGNLPAGAGHPCVRCLKQPFSNHIPPHPCGRISYFVPTRRETFPRLGSIYFFKSESFSSLDCLNLFIISSNDRLSLRRGVHS